MSTDSVVYAICFLSCICSHYHASQISCTVKQVFFKSLYLAAFSLPLVHWDALHSVMLPLPCPSIKARLMLIFYHLYRGLLKTDCWVADQLPNQGPSCLANFRKVLVVPNVLSALWKFLFYILALIYASQVFYYRGLRNWGNYTKVCTFLNYAQYSTVGLQ